MPPAKRATKRDDPEAKAPQAEQAPPEEAVAPEGAPALETPEAPAAPPFEGAPAEQPGRVLGPPIRPAD